MHSTRPSPATLQQATHSPDDVIEPFSHAADVSKQSSRSPTTLPKAASRSTSSASVYQDALGHSHLPHRMHSQDHKQDCTGHTQHTQHHVRSDPCSGEDIGWKVYCTASFTTALSMIMAELAKQVEVHCSERAHALALTWNLYSAAMDTCQSRKPNLSRLLWHIGVLQSTADKPNCQLAYSARKKKSYMHSSQATSWVFLRVSRIVLEPYEHVSEHHHFCTVSQK